MHLQFSKMLHALGIDALQEADFELVECTLCGHQCLVNHECLRVYTNPDDLSLWFLNTKEDWQPCPACGRVDWDFAAAARVSPAWRHRLNFCQADE